MKSLIVTAADSRTSSDGVLIQMIHNLLLIELNDIEKETEYVLKNEEDKIVRKGKFIRNKVQINLVHLPDGYYQFNLIHDAETISCTFKKHETDYIFSGSNVTHATQIAGSFMSKYTM